MSAPPSRKRVRSSFSSESGSDGMLPEEQHSGGQAASSGQVAVAGAAGSDHGMDHNNEHRKTK
jgi:hypothetical protein